MGKLLRNHRRNTSPFDIIEKKDNMKVKSIEVEALVFVPLQCQIKNKSRIMDKDIREMTLGEIEDLILKRYKKVKEAHYWLWDKKNNVLDMLLKLNECVLKLEKNQKFITDEEFIDNLIKDFQKEPKF